MAALHPLDLLAVLGGVVAAVLAFLAPNSRSRLVSAWVLLGTVVAAVVAAGPRPEMYSVYLLAIVLALAAWFASRQVLTSPVRQVWRTGRGSSQEHVVQTSGPSPALLRALLFLASLALLAFPLGLLPLPDFLA